MKAHREGLGTSSSLDSPLRRELRYRKTKVEYQAMQESEERKVTGIQKTFY